MDLLTSYNWTDQPEHPPDDDDEPEGEGQSGDDDDHQHVVLDGFRHLSITGFIISSIIIVLIIIIAIIIKQIAST